MMYIESIVTQDANMLAGIGLFERLLQTEEARNNKPWPKPHIFNNILERHV